jgi:DNA-binding NarL/FixJ family response regulator
VRVAARPLLKRGLVVVDDELAIIAASGPGAPGTYAVVHPGGLLTALISLFDTAWHAAAAWPCPPVTGAERGVLALLAAGFTEDAVARHLGVSVRTARRRIAELHERLGAGNRFQAGLQAARRGWL